MASTIVDELIGLIDFRVDGEEKLARFRRGLDGVEKELRGVDGKSDDAAHGLRTVGAAGHKARAGLEATRSAAGGLLGTVRNMIGPLATIAGSIASLGALTGEALDYDDAKASLRKLFQGTPEQFAQMERDIADMSTATGKSRAEIANLASEMLSAGVATEQINGRLKLLSRTASAFDMDAGPVGDYFSTLAGVLDLSTDQMTDFADSVNHATDNMQAKAAPILEFAQRTATSAKQLGLGARDIAAFGAAFQAVGVKQPEVAGTAFTTFATKVQALTPKAAKALDALGISHSQLLEDIEQRGTPALIDFFDTINQQDDSTAIISQLFDMEAVRTLGPVIQNLDKLRTAHKLANDAAKEGSVNREFLNSMQNLRRQLARMGRIIVTFFTSLGVDDTVGAITASLTTLNDVLSDLSTTLRDEGPQAFFDKLADTVGVSRQTMNDAVAVLRVLRDTFVGTFGIMRDVLLSVPTPVLMALAGAFVANKLGILGLIPSLAALVPQMASATAALWAYVTASRVANVSSKMPFAARADGFFNSIANAVLGSTGAMGGLGRKVSDTGKKLTTLQGIRATLQGGLTSLAGVVGSVLAGAWRLLISPLQLATRGLGVLAGGGRVVLGVVTRLAWPVAVLSALVVGLWNALKVYSQTGSIWAAMEAGFGSVWDFMVGGITDLIHWLSQLMFKITGLDFTGFTDKLSNAFSWDSIKGKFAGLLKGVVGGFTSLWSGLKDIPVIGELFQGAEGVADGIGGMIDDYLDGYNQRAAELDANDGVSAAAAAERGDAGEPGKDGQPGANGVDGRPGVDVEPAERTVETVVNNTATSTTEIRHTETHVAGAPGQPGKAGAAGEAGQPGKAGQPGQPGAAGLPGAAAAPQAPAPAPAVLVTLPAPPAAPDAPQAPPQAATARRTAARELGQNVAVMADYANRAAQPIADAATAAASIANEASSAAGQASGSLGSELAVAGTSEGAAGSPVTQLHNVVNNGGDVVNVNNTVNVTTTSDPHAVADATEGAVENGTRRGLRGGRSGLSVAGAQRSGA